MIDERREAQASMYSLGALPTDELREFEEILLSSLELQLLVQEFRSTAERLPFSLPSVSAPPELKQRILASIDSKGSRLAVVAPVGERPVFPAWAPWALAACLALLCVALTGLSGMWRRQITEVGNKLEQAEQGLADSQRQQEALQILLNQNKSNLTGRVGELEKQLVQKVQEAQKQKAEGQRLADKAAAEILNVQRQNSRLQARLRQAQKTPPGTDDPGDGNTIPPPNLLDQLQIGILEPTPNGSPAAVGSATWDAFLQQGVLVVENLPPPPSDKTYQLWLFDQKSGQVISGGAFVTGAGGAARIGYITAFGVESAQKFAISIEPKGGSVAPTGAVVMVSN